MTSQSMRWNWWFAVALVGSVGMVVGQGERHTYEPSQEISDAEFMTVTRAQAREFAKQFEESLGTVKEEDQETSSFRTMTGAIGPHWFLVELKREHRVNYQYSVFGNTTEPLNQQTMTGRVFDASIGRHTGQAKIFASQPPLADEQFAKRAALDSLQEDNQPYSMIYSFPVRLKKPCMECHQGKEGDPMYLLVIRASRNQVSTASATRRLGE